MHYTTNMRFLSFYIAFVLIFLCCLCGYAQSSKPVNVSVKVYEPNPNVDDRAKNPETPASSAVILVFKTKNEAQKFVNAQKQLLGDDIVKIDEDALTSYKDSVKTTLYGEAEVNAVPANWYLVSYRDQLLSDVVAIDGKNDIKIILKSQVRELKEVEKTGKMDRQKIKKRNLGFGDTRILQADIAIFPEDANSTMRYGLSPFTTVATNSYAFTSEYQKRNPVTDSIFKNIRPYLIDGEDYAKTQLRKMGYDETNDPLALYVDRNQKIKTRAEEDSLGFHVYEVLRPVKQDAIYPTYAYLWRENYGNLVVLDTLLIDDGYANFPMRFIDFAFPEVEIDASKYARLPKRSVQEGKDMLDIQFVNGKAEILASDSVGLQQLDAIIKTLEKIARDPDGRLFGVDIHGYASPEGGRAVNENLCVQRARFLQHKVIANLSGVDSNVKGSVASWQDVADLLREDSIADPENLVRARQIEEIIASSSSPSQIDSKIQSSSFYRFLKENEDKYYKPLRKVEIAYQYSLQRVLDRDEIIQRYEKKEDLSFPYQYQYLFEYLKDRPKELEQVAKKAMAMNDAKEPTGKPWTLAAYYLAKSYIARDTCDVELLKPYITLTGAECRKERPGSWVRKASGCPTYLNAEHVGSDGSLIQYVNDAGIVMMQISMLVKAGKIFEAFQLSDNLLPDNDPQYHQPKTVLECMDGSWTVPSVRETVAATSDWNKVVVYAAQDDNPDMDEAFWEDAWNLLNDSTIFKMESPRELYMKASLARRLYTTAKNWNNRKDEIPVPAHFFDFGDNDVYSHPSFNDDTYPWGATMIKACEMAPSFINILKFDGEFNQNYRDGFALQWNEKHPDNILK